MKVLIQQQDKWVPVGNKFEYGSKTNMIVPEETDPMGDAVVPIYPDVGSIRQPVKIRVIVVGTVYKDNEPTSTQTAAYVDWILYP